MPLNSSMINPFRVHLPHTIKVLGLVDARGKIVKLESVAHTWKMKCIMTSVRLVEADEQHD